MLSRADLYATCRLGHSSVEVSEVFTILDGVVRKQLPRRRHHARPKVSLGFYHCEASHCEEGIAKLVKVVIEELAQAAAVVRPPRLLAVDGVQGLIPEHSECIQEERCHRQSARQA